jgi:magnesium transporter
MSVVAEAHAHDTAQVPTARPGERAGEVRARLLTERYESVDDVAVVDDDRLVGLVRVEDLLPAPADAPVRALMDPDPPVVAPGLVQERVAQKAVAHGESSLAVVGADGRFLGLIPPWRMLGVLLDEHEEDLARLGGYLAQSRSAREAAEERVARRFWHRLPWLLVGLVAAMLSAVIVSGFEEALADEISLAFFLPGVVYIADAVGTQTETVIIRGLSVGVSVRQVARRELVTGLAIGLCLAVAFVPFGMLLVDSSAVVASVALSLLAAASVASGVALVLPSVLARTGVDPAFGSGPLATVVQDLLSILIYFAVAAALV